MLVLQALWFFSMVMLVVILLHKWSGFIEPFADASEEAITEAKEAIKIAADSICPTLEEVLETYMQDAQGSQDEKRQYALQKVQKEAKGLLFACPPPEDPLFIASDIDKRIVGTIQYLLISLAEIKQKILKSLNECPDGFQDMCTPEQEKLRQETEAKKAAESSATSCSSPKELSTEDKNKILKQRSAAIQRALTEGTVQEGLTKIPIPKAIVAIKALAEEIRTIKIKAERGELETNCKK